jgi:hypothetical protein
MMAPLCDGHVALESPFASFNAAIHPGCWGVFLQHVMDEFENQADYDDPFEYFLQAFRPSVLANIEDHYLVNGMKSGARGNILWGRLTNRVAYLSVLQMANYAREDATPAEDLDVLAGVLDEVMADFTQSDALVIDLRLNTGGYDHVALDIADRFAHQPRVAFTKKARWREGFTERTAQISNYPGHLRFTKPITILTSELTASAAENFLLAMHSLPYVTLIGEKTAGVHSDVLVRELPNGWAFSLSNEVYEAANGEVFEARGFTPAVEIASPRTQHIAQGRDYAIEAALTRLETFQMNAGLNDAWYNPETSGQGFFITIFPDLNYTTLAWFTYDTNLPPQDAMANLGDPGHRWLTALGLIEGNSSVMNIDITSDGIFDMSSEIQHTEPAGSDGTLTLRFDDCSSGTVEYDIPSIGRQGSIPIQRVVNDNIALCRALAGEITE